MARGKIHKEIVLSEPTEADTAGESLIACGLDGVADASQLTTDDRAVTCKHCMRRIHKDKLPQ